MVQLTPWDRRELPGLFTVEQTATRVGRYKWIEMRLFEIIGGWVATVDELDVKLRLGTHCHHHSFHAELWHRRLPELRDMNPERLTAPANREIETFIRAVNEPGAGQTLEKLVGLYRVFLPHLIAAYTFHLNNTSQVSDAPTIRALNFCLLDDVEEWREGEMTIQSLAVTPEAIDRAAAHQAELTKLLVAAGGVIGAGSVERLKHGSEPADNTGAKKQDRPSNRTTSGSDV